MDTTPNNNKNINDFCLKPLMKSERHILLAHLHLLSTKNDSLLNFYLLVSKFHLFLSSRTDLRYYSSSFFCSQIWPLKNLFLCLPPPSGKNHPWCAGPLEISPLMCWARPGPMQTSNLDPTFWGYIYISGNEIVNKYQQRF